MSPRRIALARIALGLIAPIGVTALCALLPPAPADVPAEGRAGLGIFLLLAASIATRMLKGRGEHRRDFDVALAVLAAAEVLRRVVSEAAGLVVLAVAWPIFAATFLFVDLRIVHRSGWAPRARALLGSAAISLFVLIWLPIATPLALTLLLPCASRIAHGDETTQAGEALVSFGAADGTVLRGTLTTGGAQVPVVLVHGHADGRSRFAPWARALAAEGHPTLRFDHRAHGTSAGTLCTLADREIDDTARAARLLAARTGAPRVVLFGASMGGGVALAAARSVGTARVAAVVALAPASDYGAIVRMEGLRGPLFLLGELTMHALGLRPFSELAPARRMPSDVPILIVHSRSDATIPYSLSTRLAVHANAGVELVDGVAHDQIPSAALGRSEVRELIEDFLAAPDDVVRRLRRRTSIE